MSVMKHVRLINNVIIDYGCSNHIYCVRSDFDELHDMKHGDVRLADGSIIPIEGEGMIKIKVKTLDGHDTIITYEALYVPRLAARLFSVRRATEQNGYTFVFGDVSYMMTPEGIKVMIVKHEGVYVFKSVLNEAIQHA